MKTQEQFAEEILDQCMNGTSVSNLMAVLEEYRIQLASQLEPPVKPVDYGTCKNCIFNLETDENSLVSECQLTIDEFTGIGLQFSRDFGCNQWQSKPSV